MINIDHQLLRDTEVGYYISTPKTGMRGRERNGPSTSCMDWIGMKKIRVSAGVYKMATTV